VDGGCQPAPSALVVAGISCSALCQGLTKTPILKRRSPHKLELPKPRENYTTDAGGFSLIHVARIKAAARIDAANKRKRP
jgi:hypothetical protein